MSDDSWIRRLIIAIEYVAPVASFLQRSVDTFIKFSGSVTFETKPGLDASLEVIVSPVYCYKKLLLSPIIFGRYQLDPSAGIKPTFTKAS